MTKTLAEVLAPIKGANIGISITGLVGNNLQVANVLREVFSARLRWGDNMNVLLAGIHTNADTCVIRSNGMDFAVPIKELELVQIELPGDE